MTYGYARVSSTDQNLDRQIEALKAEGIDERHILCDKASGKDFDRKAYNSLVGTADTAPMLREGDLLIILSLDRLGRNYSEIRGQWEHITNGLKADIKVLDMPLLDTSTSSDNLDRRFMADLVLQILSYVAEKERLSIRERQAQGIAAAKAAGKPLGRPRAEYPAEWEKYYTAWQGGEITATKAMEELGMKRTTFYKLVGQYEDAKPNA
ncbi:recombinase family protein [Ruminococcaceae bacterium OttesenSCG-928-D13]|nr:recombinase family protein [Ruminococcaceae bacterium OttesenSCG-928-D13]